MIEWLLPRFLHLKYLVGEVHKVAEVVNATAWQQVILSAEVEPSCQVLQQAGIHFAVEYKSNRFAFSAIL